ncbi:HAD family hydrolase [Robiginitalea sp. IMCC44478]|uniref:HAD family hydrolase n=1 Tax=Robiginitalea sp. IMCC44478 TaxID=3459122 RepID=UPI004040F8A3
MDLKDIRLVVTDMDGTLLNSRHEVSDRFFELQAALQQKGVRFVAASGRQYRSIADKLDRIQEQLIFIAENGGLVRYRGEEWLSTPLDKSLRQEVLEVLSGVEGAHSVLCGKQQAYLEDPGQAFLKHLEEYYSDYEIIDNLQGFEGEIMKIAVYHFENSEACIYPAVQPFEDRLKVKVSGRHWVDLSDRKAHKGYALQLVQERLGIGPEQTMAFGDYNNDLEMLGRAAFSFAMENAHPNVKRVARFSTASNEQGGVEQVLENLLGQL